MKGGRLLVTLSAIVGLLANALAVISYLTTLWPWPRWRPEPDEVLIVSSLFAAYGLAAWSALAWRWTAGSGRTSATGRPVTTFALNVLAAFPVLTGWIYLLSTVENAAFQAPLDRWLLSLALGWVAAPFAALAMVQLGGVLGPLTERGRDDTTSP